MITKEEIKKIAFSQGLSPTTIEKDYVLGWILLGIAKNPQLSNEWIFKGGTCLKKCYFKKYRFFKDCDPFLLRKTLYKKCAYKNIENLDVYNLDWSSCKASWQTQLAHQIKELVDFEDYKKSAEIFLKTLIQ